MNNSVYVFGNLGVGYTQYPEDYAHEIYEEFQLKAEAPSQVIIHRDKSIMYYGYVRKLDRDGQYIGLCVLLNGVMLSKMASLFSVFEKVVSEMVSQGELIKMDENGDIIGVAERLDDKQQEVERIVTYLREEVIHWESTATKLPPISYSISNDSYRTFSITDKDEEIVEASAKYGFVSVQKNEEYDTPLLAGLRNVLKQRSGEQNLPHSNTQTIGVQETQKRENSKTMKDFLWLFAIIVPVIVFIVVIKRCSNEDIKEVSTMDSLVTDTLVNDDIVNVSTAATKEAAIQKRIEELWKCRLDYSSYDDCLKYCSSDFRNLRKKVEKAWEIESEYGGEPSWFLGSDFGDYKNVEVKIRSLSFEDAKMAMASVMVFDPTGGNKWQITSSMKLVYENEDWYVDDFINEGKSDKEEMTEYVKAFGIDVSSNDMPDVQALRKRYLKELLSDSEWNESREGFRYPKGFYVCEETSEELDGSYWNYGVEGYDVQMNYFVTFGSVAADIPWEGCGLGAGHSVKSITYQAEDNGVYSGYTNKGDIYYLKKHVSRGDAVISTGYVLVLIYPKEFQDEVKPLIDAVKNW